MPPSLRLWTPFRRTSLRRRFGLDRTSVTAHVGQRSLTVRPNRTRFRFGRFLSGRNVGSAALGVLAVSWLRRSPGGGRRWGLERQAAAPSRSR